MRAQQQVHELQRERGLAALHAAMTGRPADAAVSFQRYTDRIAELNQPRAAVDRIIDPALRNGVLALEAAGAVKEATAQERGHLTVAFAIGAIEPLEYTRLVDMRASRKAGIASFDRAATASQRTALHAVFDSPAAVEVARYEAIALGGGSGRLPEQVDPDVWWTVMTGVIDSLRSTQQVIAEDVQRRARQLQRGSVEHIVRYVSLGVLALTAEAALFIGRGRPLSRVGPHDGPAPTGSDAAAKLVAEINSELLRGMSANNAWQLVARRMTEFSSASCVLILRRADRGLSAAPLTACVGDGAAELQDMRAAIEHSCLVDVLKSGTPVLVDDLADHLGSTSTGIGPAAAVPLHAGSGIRGLLIAARGTGSVPFTPGQVSRLASLTDQAALALEVAEQQETKQFQDLVEERHRIALELYHGVIRRLVGIGMSLQGTLGLIQHTQLHGRVGTVIGQLDDTVNRMRTSIFDLQAGPEHDANLRQRLLDLIIELIDDPDLLPMISMTGSVDRLVSSDIAHHAEVVVREAVTNVVRHARATELTLTADAADRLTISVTDNGVGLPHNAVRSGLLNLEQRATQLGGRLAIDRRPTSGTRLIWSVPLR